MMMCFEPGALGGRFQLIVLDAEEKLPRKWNTTGVVVLQPSIENPGYLRVAKYPEAILSNDNPILEKIC